MVIERDDIPQGAIAGRFSVSQWKSIFFSKGNLQYQASTGIWRFSDHQFDIMGDRNTLISSDNNNLIDLFACGTGGDPIKYYKNNRYVDWGNNRIVNGGPRRRLWRTLSWDEWNYVIKWRRTVSGLRYAKAEVCGVNGIILVPDNWENALVILNNANSPQASFRSNIISETQWLVLEQSGMVFLPCAGYRGGNSYYGFGSYGGYWSASFFSGGSSAYALNFDDSNMGVDILRYSGLSVRLVYAKDYVL